MSVVILLMNHSMRIQPCQDVPGLHGIAFSRVSQEDSEKFTAMGLSSLGGSEKPSRSPMNLTQAPFLPAPLLPQALPFSLPSLLPFILPPFFLSSSSLSSFSRFFNILTAVSPPSSPSSPSPHPLLCFSPEKGRSPVDIHQTGCSETRHPPSC